MQPLQILNLNPIYPFMIYMYIYIYILYIYIYTPVYTTVYKPCLSIYTVIFYLPLVYTLYIYIYIDIFKPNPRIQGTAVAAKSRA